MYEAHNCSFLLKAFLLPRSELLLHPEESVDDIRVLVRTSDECICFGGLPHAGDVANPF